MTSRAENFPISCGAATTSFTRIFAKRSLSEVRVLLGIEEVRRATSTPSQFSVVVQDRNALRSVTANYVTDFRLFPVPIFDAGLESQTGEYAIVSLDGSIASDPDSGGIATFGAPGKARFLGVTGEGESSIATATSQSATGGTVDVFQSYVSGSLAQHIVSQIDSRLSSTSRTLFSTHGDGAGNYVRNTSCWAAGVNLSCVSPWNSTGGRSRAGTLVTRRHAVFCRHADFYPAVGASIRFVGAAAAAGQSEQVFTTTIQSLTTNTGGVPLDVCVARLADEAPSYINHASILPSNWTSRLPSVNTTLSGSSSTVGGAPQSLPQWLPVAYLTQDASIFVAAWRGNYPTSYAGSTVLQLFGASLGRESAYQAIRVGDSGQPIFTFINNAPVLLSTFTSELGGPFHATASSIIQGMIDSLGGGYQLTNVDLSGFPTY